MGASISQGSSYYQCLCQANIKSGYSESELSLHHELSGSINIQFNKAVTK